MSNYLKKLAYVHDAMRKLAAGPDMSNKGDLRVKSPAVNPVITLPPPSPAKVNSAKNPSVSTTTTTSPAVPLERQMNSRRHRTVGGTNASRMPNITDQQWSAVKAYQENLIDGLMRRDGITREQAVQQLTDKGRYYKLQDALAGKYIQNKRFNDIASGKRTWENIKWQGGKNPYDAMPHQNYINGRAFGNNVPVEIPGVETIGPDSIVGGSSSSLAPTFDPTLNRDVLSTYLGEKGYQPPTFLNSGKPSASAGDDVPYPTLEQAKYDIARGIPLALSEGHAPRHTLRTPIDPRTGGPMPNPYMP